MRESRPYGSERGAFSNGRPYRDRTRDPDLSKVARRGCFAGYQRNISLSAGDSRARVLGEGGMLDPLGPNARRLRALGVAGGPAQGRAVVNRRGRP